MKSVEAAQLKETPEQAESWVAEDLTVAHETVKKMREQVSNYLELSQSEFMTLMVQCSLLVVIGGIVASLISA